MRREALSGILLAALAFVGLIDAAYVGITSTQGFVIPCGLTGGCDQVLNSSYSKVAGVSIAWIGLGFYAFVLSVGVFAVFGFFGPMRLSLAVSLAAFAVNLYLLYLQAFVLKAYCDYCLLSALLITLILGVHISVRPWKWE